MSHLENQSAPWYGGHDCQISSEASKHIRTRGKQYLAAHLQGVKYLADIGCWNGRHIPFIKLSASYHPRTIGKRFQDARRNHPEATLRLSELQALDLEDGVVGGAICWRVLHNLSARPVIGCAKGTPPGAGYRRAGGRRCALSL